MLLFKSIKNQYLILTVAFALTALYNWSFFKHVNQVYPALNGNLGFFISLAVMAFVMIALALSLLCNRYTTKPILIVFVLIAAFAAYYMDTFDVIIDKIMIQNIVETNVKEARDLLTFKLVLYVLILGVLPAVWIYRQPTIKQPVWSALRSRLQVIGLLLLIIFSQALIFSKNYSSFFREQKTVRYYINPLTPIYSAFKFIKPSNNGTPTVVASLGVDATIPATDTERDLVILVIGETARWDRFSLNGYNKPTNPLLAKENVVSFKNFTSCGTSTAVSVPCMFSPFGRTDYNEKKFKASENLLDVLVHADVNVLWRENNSDSKGVVTGRNNQKITFQDYKDSKLNTVCDIECRDEGMLIGLQKYIDQHPEGDITIVLHAMGSHGPAYYKRYPAEFEQFKPACHESLLEKCSIEEISNAYDNTILYTDYFLSKVIALLKENTPKFEAMMFYMGDHGESLGEKGVYLHGMPYAIAPEVQKHVGALMWVSDNIKETSYEELKRKENLPLSHDNFFHTALGLMEIESKDYKPEKDILRAQ